MKQQSKKITLTHLHIHPLFPFESLLSLYLNRVCPDGPGTCVSYSSTGFILAGLVLLNHASKDQNTWETYDQKQGLGLTPDDKDSAHTHFPRVGTMADPTLLTTAGSSLQYGQAEVYKQDASILGWTCGNGISSALDAALFEYDLLSPGFDHTSSTTPGKNVRDRRQIVSNASLAQMLQFKTLSVGWAKGEVDYGGGLMVQNVNLKYAGREWAHK